MQIGAKTSKKLGKIYRDKSQASIDYALDVIRRSAIARYVDQVFLYGSCARCEQNYNSDVDLFLQLKEGTDIEQFRTDLIKLTSMVTPADTGLPEVDLKIMAGEKWRTKKDLYFKNVRKEGIPIW